MTDFTAITLVRPGGGRSKGRLHERERDGGIQATIKCHLPIALQIHAVGPTWLDQQILTGQRDLGQTGFGAEARIAAKMRVEVLIAQNLVQRRGSTIAPAPGMLATLRDRELRIAAQRLERKTGKLWRSTPEGQPILGIYSESIQLAAGRFAVLEANDGFRLLPWRSVLENRLG